MLADMAALIPVGWAGQGHLHCHSVWCTCNAKTFSPWEKAALHFQCILESIKTEQITNRPLYTTTWHACAEQLCGVSAQSCDRTSEKGSFCTFYKISTLNVNNIEAIVAMNLKLAMIILWPFCYAR